MPESIIEVDTTQLMEDLKEISVRLGKDNVKKVAARTLRKTVKHLTSRQGIVAGKVEKYYVPKKTDISKSMKGRAETVVTAEEASAIVRSKGKRHSIGGINKAGVSVFPVKGINGIGGAYGWEAKKYKGHPYPIYFEVKRGATSLLPEKMNNKTYGGLPPFRNLSAPSLHGVTFTRKGKARLPILKVPSIAIPQMVATDAKKEIQQETADYLQKTLKHEYEFEAGQIKHKK